MKWKTPIIYCI